IRKRMISKPADSTMFEIRVSDNPNKITIPMRPNANLNLQNKREPATMAAKIATEIVCLFVSQEYLDRHEITATINIK
ncbi:MAG: hypothetical protein QXO71_05430, partial [Candidatus Jordarchaeaceae archaeon]